jgi:hypothetical protein
MTIFWLLFLAHLIADFPLQTSAIYSFKKKKIVGILPHVAIYSAINVLVLLPFLNSVHTWLSIIALFVVHTIVDRGKLIFVQTNSRDNLLHFLLDQIIHILSIWVISLWLNNHINHCNGSNYLFFDTPRYAVLLSGLIIGTFAGTAIIHYIVIDLERLFIKKPSLTRKYPDYPKRLIGFAERLVAILGIVLGGVFMLFTVMAFIPKCLLKWRQRTHRIIIYEAFAGIVVSICAGLLIRTYW